MDYSPVNSERKEGKNIFKVRSNFSSPNLTQKRRMNLQNEFPHNIFLGSEKKEKSYYNSLYSPINPQIISKNFTADFDFYPKNSSFSKNDSFKVQ